MPTSPSLPVLPVPHARALAALQDPDGDIAELAVAIEGDPALTMAVLRAANSAASAPVNRVDRAERAIMRIGFNATRRIVTGRWSDRRSATSNARGSTRMNCGGIR